MNRMSNKDFQLKSCLNDSQRTFSDVFCPASCMQSRLVRELKESMNALFKIPVSSTQCSPIPTVNTFEEL